MTKKQEGKRIYLKDKIKEGDTFGRLTAIKFAGYRMYNLKPRLRKTYGKSTWEFKCSCGKVKEIECYSVYSGNVSSCGCLQKENASRIAKIHNEKVRSVDQDDLAFRSLYNNYKKRAKHKNKVFELTKEDFRNLTSLNCHYCGVPPNNIKYSTSKRGKYIFNGIDRVDSKQGYILSNCITCCEFCNRAKIDLDKSKFEEWIARLISFNKNILYEKELI